MANHRAVGLLLIASLLVAVVLSGADAKTTAVRRDAYGGYHYNHDAAAPVPEELTCNKEHGVQAGDTCFDVGTGAGLTQEQFFSFNPNVNCDNLFVGQWICLDATCA